MKLSQLLEILTLDFPRLPKISPECAAKNIVAITSDSQSVKPGVLFVAVPGTRVDGHSFLNAAEAAGAEFLIGERDPEEFGISPEKYLKVSDARLAVGLLASQIVDNPSREMVIVGITGTSGKTTTSYLVESILSAAGKKVGLIGTVAYRIDGVEIPSTHTTPGPVELHQLLRRMRREGCDAVVMEVSSHALKQSRAAGVAFDGAIFTNLSPEHLDYHPDLEDYFQSKRILFARQTERSVAWGKHPVAVVHADSSDGARLLEEFSAATPFSVPSDARLDTSGISANFSGIAIRSKLIGRFNAENIAGAVALAKALGIRESSVREGISRLERVPGRLDEVPDPIGGRVILVDYAHKPDALEKVLHVLRPMLPPGNKLICVFGCGGDRDRSKRRVMGEIACRLSDIVILTSDNPRTENPENILAEIESGCTRHHNWRREVDRKRAIELAIHQSARGDIVLIAGKGHEDYQIIGTEKIHFDDREVAADAL